MDFSNHYEVLGLHEGATHDEINQAFLRLALKWHPDRHAGHSASIAEAHFKKINEAKETLLNRPEENEWLKEEWKTAQESRPRHHRTSRAAPDDFVPETEPGWHPDVPPEEFNPGDHRTKSASPDDFVSEPGWRPEVPAEEVVEFVCSSCGSQITVKSRKAGTTICKACGAVNSREDKAAEQYQPEEVIEYLTEIERRGGVFACGLLGLCMTVLGLAFLFIDGLTASSLGTPALLFGSLGLFVARPAIERVNGIGRTRKDELFISGWVMSVGSLCAGSIFFLTLFTYGINYWGSNAGWGWPVGTAVALLLVGLLAYAFYKDAERSVGFIGWILGSLFWVAIVAVALVLLTLGVLKKRQIRQFEKWLNENRPR